MPAMARFFQTPLLNRRALMSGALGVSVQLALGARVFAAQPPGFANWVAEFRGRASRRGISAQTYA
jgi:membrane-bound lytic murein transglycosylase B